MTSPGKRVGSRQWRILLAALNSELGVITGKEARRAIGDDLQAAHAKAALAGLTGRGLMSHACPAGCPGQSATCQYMITAEGENARLGDQGGWHGGGRPYTAAISS